MRKLSACLLIVLLLCGCSNEEKTKKQVKKTKVSELNCEVNLPDNFKIRFKNSFEEDYTIYKLQTEKILVIVNNNVFTDNMEYYQEVTKDSKTGWVHLKQETDYEFGWMLEEKIYSEQEVEELLSQKMGKILTGCNDFKKEIYHYPNEEIVNVNALKFKSLTEENYQVLLHPEYRISLKYSNSDMNIETLLFFDNITSIVDITLPNTYLFDIKL
ncbi:MAG: hypothetical protein PHU94_02085 [Bacilli bacterium]|nr:hypothetical protein [Bacilli bacterium]MDD4733569.1 hypothetical protein [Bacilli bacterium]